jgi:hypothetical protein
MTLSDASSATNAMARAQGADTANVDVVQSTPNDAAKNDGQPAPQQAGADESTKPAEAPAKADGAAAKSEPASDQKPDGIKADTAQPTAAPDATKDQTRLGDAAKPAISIPDIPKGKGQIAVFISRKDSKLYVRQRFSPLFDVPVTIAASDRPLGTHVFTAQTDKTDSNLLHWSVVSLPVPVRSLVHSEDGERASRHHKGKIVQSAEAKPLPVPDSPAEALDRITIPPEVMTRIAEAMTTGGSIIVSDQGINQGETGEGTDFIIALR